MRRWVLYGSRKANMYFADAGLSNDCPSVLNTNPSASHNNRAAARGLNQLCDHLCALQTFLLAPRRKNPVGPGTANVLESTKQVSGYVESSMEGYGEWTGRFDKLPGALDIDFAIFA